MAAVNDPTYFVLFVLIENVMRPIAARETMADTVALVTPDLFPGAHWTVQTDKRAQGYANGFVKVFAIAPYQLSWGTLNDRDAAIGMLAEIERMRKQCGDHG